MRTLLPRLSVGLLGGTGFAGRHLAARLVRDGHDVTILTRRRHRHRDLLVLPTMRLLEGDPADVPTLRDAFGRCDALVNLAGMSARHGVRRAADRRAHAEMTAAALSACQSGGPRRYVQMSTLKADPAAASPYLRLNGEAETRVRESDLAWTILQPSVIFGPDDHFISGLARHLRLLPIVPLPRAATRLSPVFVGDVASAVVRVLRDPRTVAQTVQLCGPRVYSVRELAELIGDATGRRRPLWPLSPTIGRLLAHLLDLFPDSPFSSDNLQTLSAHSICDSAAPGFQSLGIQPVALEATLSTRWPPGAG